jgi:hypothetical protein
VFYKIINLFITLISLEQFPAPVSKQETLEIFTSVHSQMSTSRILGQKLSLGKDSNLLQIFSFWKDAKTGFGGSNRHIFEKSPVLSSGKTDNLEFSKNWYLCSNFIFMKSTLFDDSPSMSRGICP